MEAVTEIRDSVPAPVANATEEQREQIVAVDFKMVTFTLAGKDYAIDIMKVKEIAKAGHFTYVPNTVPFVLGVYNLRGDIIPIVDLRRFFNIDVPEREKDALENMLIVTVEEQLFGVVVDAIDKVIGIQKSSIQPPHPLFGDINIKYIYGVVESNNRLYVLLDIDRIFGARVPAHTETSSENDSSVVQEKPVAQEKLHAVSAAKMAEKRQETVVEEKNEPEPAPNIDYTFIKDGLQKLKNFNVSPVNETWVKHRFDDWVASRGSDNSQLANEKDAEDFISPFYSSNTATFWSKEYAQAVYKALPENAAKQISVWNPGCGKGYEAYSLACLLHKRYPEARIKIYAQDIDLLNISNAPLLSVPADVAGGWYSQFLVKSVSGTYSFKPEIKDMILFEYHDCMHANTMPMVDLIFTRDLLSFLSSTAQATLLEDFDEKLKGSGLVFVGENESLSYLPNWSEKMIGSVVVYTKQ
ncbi:MAG: chemotaxis protein CheW [Spirochaetaceae bacterium]|nr:chemotaxis protein CheW [Spirochaetaceae bacterium]